MEERGELSCVGIPAISATDSRMGWGSDLANCLNISSLTSPASTRDRLSLDFRHAKSVLRIFGRPLSQYPGIGGGICFLDLRSPSILQGGFDRAYKVLAAHREGLCPLRLATQGTAPAAGFIDGVCIGTRQRVRISPIAPGLQQSSPIDEPVAGAQASEFVVAAPGPVPRMLHRSGSNHVQIDVAQTIP